MFSYRLLSNLHKRHDFIMKSMVWQSARQSQTRNGAKPQVKSMSFSAMAGSELKSFSGKRETENFFCCIICKVFVSNKHLFSSIDINSTQPIDDNVDLSTLVGLYIP